MRKIPTLFVRDFTDPLNPVLTDQVKPGCEWVLAGEGQATRKYDGVSVLIRRDGLAVKAFARRDVKPGKTPPPNFVLAEHDLDTDRRFGWIPAEESDFRKYIAQAVAEHLEPVLPGTYELVGPKINGNPERFGGHVLVKHSDADWIKPFSLTFEGLRDTVRVLKDKEGIEGIVWHHPDGRMAKLKAKDFR